MSVKYFFQFFFLHNFESNFEKAAKILKSAKNEKKWKQHIFLNNYFIALNKGVHVFQNIFLYFCQFHFVFLISTKRDEFPFFFRSSDRLANHISRFS